MCVDKEHYTCCCCSLTTATYVLGVLQILGTISYACWGDWISFCISAVVSLVYLLIFMDSSNPNYRKLIFQLNAIGLVCSIIVLTVVFILALVGNDTV